MTDFEAVIVGAGPAGAMMAKELAERKFRVLIIEKELEIGYPNKSTAATPIDTFEAFNLPRSLAFEDIVGFRVFGPSQSYEMNFGRVLGKVFDFRKLKQYLLTEAIKGGAEVILGAEVKNVLKKSGKVAGVTYKGYTGVGKVYADVVIDASGPQGVLASKLGLWKKNPEKLGVAFEYFLENAKPDKAGRGFYLDLYFGTKIAPGGYAWIFPTNLHQVKAGICKLKPGYKVPKEKSQLQYFNDFWKENHQIKTAQPFELHDCAHYITGGEKGSVLDNFVAIGDAVNKVNPIFGEGVRPSLYSAKFAAEAIDKARKLNNYSKRVLGLYEKLWRGKWGVNWFFAKVVFDILYGANDTGLDNLIKSVKKFNPETLYKLYVGKAKKKDYLSFVKNVPGVTSMKLVSSITKSFLD